jgi:DNA-binding NarL/FixJ family response regulator
MSDEGITDNSLLLSSSLEVVRDLISKLDGISSSEDASHIVVRLDILNRMLVNLEVDDSILEISTFAFDKITKLEMARSSSTEVPLRSRGRPSFEIEEGQLNYLLDQGFKVKDISNMLGVSKRTVERRMSFFGMSVSGE